MIEGDVIMHKESGELYKIIGKFGHLMILKSEHTGSTIYVPPEFLKYYESISQVH